MRWEDRGVSKDVEDLRGQGRAGGFGFPGGGGGARVGCGTLVVLLLLSVIFRQNFLQLLDVAPAEQGVPSSEQAPPMGGQPNQQADTPKRFVSTVLDNVQNTWEQTLPGFGGEYRRTTLRLFDAPVRTGCGVAQSAMGPFYCPVDESVYIDLRFYEELRTRFGAAGDFAEAYVLAHEVGHHLQKVVGTEGQMRRAQQRRPDLANQLSVRLELQADCYAGVWAGGLANSGIEPRIELEAGDIEEGMNAAAAVGDDRIQQQTQGYVVQDAFTHGSSEQRVAWFRRGLEARDLRQCDTFAQ